MRIILVLLLAVLSSGGVQAEGTIKSFPSRFPVEETVQRLTAAVEGKGITVAARIDHAAGAKAAGLELPPMVVVIFGNPKLGTPLLQADPRVGIDLPMKVLVWQDKVGKVWLGYTPPSTLQARHGLAGDVPIDSLKTMAAALEGFAKAATGVN